MKRITSTFLVLLLALCSNAKTEDKSNLSVYNKKLEQSGILFVENRGQVSDIAGKPRPDILFTAQNGGTKVFLTKTGISYQFAKVIYPQGYNAVATNNADIELQTELAHKIETQTYNFSLTLEGANPLAKIRKENKNSYTENYYLPQCPNGITNVSSYEKLVYENIYPHIDWVVYSNGSGLKYDFIVKPGGNANQIKLKVKDAQGVSISTAGELLIKTTLGEVVEKAPVSFANGKDIPTHFVQNNDGSIGFAVGYIPTGTTLVIDPSVTWATYYGGSSGDQGFSCATDASGNVFLSGLTASLTPIAASGGFQTTLGGSNDAFLVKFNASGTRLWATYYGGSSAEVAPMCETDNSGNVYLAGQTASTSGIASAGAHQTVYGGGVYDAFLVKFNASGARLWATYYGGTDQEAYGNCSIDASGNIYLSSITKSTTGIATAGAYQTTLNGSQDLYLAKFDASGTRIWGTYIGGNNGENCFYHNCSVDNSGNIFVQGYTTSTTGLATAGAYQTSYGGGTTDDFLAKFNASGSLLWATYFGGPSVESLGTYCSTDAFGNIFICGGTQSTSGLASAGAYQTAIAGGLDAFIAKFNSDGGFRWCTYYGGTGTDLGQSYTTDPSGNVFLVGFTSSAAADIVTADGFQTTYGGANDAFIVKFDSTGSRQWGSYFGGVGTEQSAGTANDGMGNVYMAGYTATASGLATAGAHQTSSGGGNDAFLVKIQDNIPLTITTGAISASPICEGSTISVPYTITGIYTAGNIFSAQLSDASGSFSTPVTIGTVSATTDGSISAIIPLATAGGSAYRIRVISSTPSIIGSDNGTNLTITPLPVAGTNTGTATVCVAATTTLSNAISGGTWSSTATGIATIDASGVVTGVTSGTATISYTVTNSCGTAAATTVITVNALPDAGTITGTAIVCEMATTTLSNTVSGGTWSSTMTGIATIDASGVVSGVANGTSTISYTVTNTCGTAAATTIVSVNPLPTVAANTGTATVCVAATTTLSNATSGGTWSSTATAIATVTASGVVSGIAAGTATISYTVTNSCGTVAATTIITVNALPNAGTITGTAVVCETATTALSNAITGGTWSSSATSIATVDASGIVSGIASGTSTISYTVTNTCGSASSIVIATVNALTDAGTITGTLTVCQSATTTLSATISGGVWSSDATGIATVTSTGVVTGVAGGTATISYTVTGSCGSAAATGIVSVNPLPGVGAIAGLSEVCVASTIILSDATSGGVWSSTATGVATIDATGLVTGIGAGTTTISYTVTSGCGPLAATKIILVNPLPYAGVITGAATLCQGSTTTLSNVAAVGGIWTSSSPAIATVSASGTVTGITAGTINISYTVTNICGTAYTTHAMTINPLPVFGTITGTSIVCIGNSVNLSNTASGGTWVSSLPGIASVSATGVVNGLSLGTTTISYVVTNGCGTLAATHVMTVNPALSAITGASVLCSGTSTILSDASPGGTWSSSSTSIATVIPATGSVSGVAGGLSTISYIVSTGCYATRAITVNASPTPYSVTGGGTYCAGGSGLSVGLAGSDVGVNYQLFSGASTIGGPLPGTGSALSFGTFTVAGAYSVSAVNTTNGCTNNMVGSAGIAILPVVLPAVTVSSSPGVVVCSGTLVNFTAVPVNGGTSPVYEWSVNGVPTGAGGSFFPYTPANGDIILVKMSSSLMCAIPDTAINSVMMTIDTAALPAVTISSTSGDTVCVSSLATFTAATSYCGSLPTYQWRVNGVNVSTASTYSYFPLNGDIVTLSVASNYACRLADTAYSNIIHVSVILPSSLTVSINAHPGTTILPGQIDTLTAVVSGGTSYSYQWNWNGIIIPGATNATYFSPFANNDSVTCVVTNNDACANTAHASVTIHVSASITDNNGAIHHLNIVPNPNSGSFAIQGYISPSFTGNVLAEVHNMIGQTIYKGNISVISGSINEHIELSYNLPSGAYMISITTAGDKQVLQFVKQ